MGSADFCEPLARDLANGSHTICIEEPELDVCSCPHRNAGGGPISWDAVTAINPARTTARFAWRPARVDAAAIAVDADVTQMDDILVSRIPHGRAP
jgi:hypothetical protein